MPYAPGNTDSRKKSLKYRLQLQEKQKLRHAYGMTECSLTSVVHNQRW